VIIRLTSKQLRLLKEVTRKSFPVEACAIPFGKIAAEEAIVTKIVVAPNILQSSVRFKINPEEACILNPVAIFMRSSDR